MKLRSALLLLASAVPQLRAQEVRIEQERVTEVLRYLASDELGGRGTPSRGQTLAAEYLAKAFKKAGLQPGAGESMFHGFQLDGIHFAAGQGSLRLHLEGVEEPLVLKPGVDFRVYRPGRGAVRRERSEVQIIDPKVRQRRRAMRQPRLVPIAATEVLWRNTVGSLALVSRGMRRFGAAPTLLVRKAVWPETKVVAADLDLPAPKSGKVALRNVVAYWPGTDPKAGDVMVGAHYDHVGTRLGGGADAVFNGADDNATGTTAVLCIAEAVAKAGKRFPCGILFVCFSAEEMGLLGSKAYVEAPPRPLKSLRALINLEMLGRPPAQGPRHAWVTGVGYSNFGAVIEAPMAAAGVKLVNFPMAVSLFRASDNYPFARAGVVAHSISAGSLHRDYHQPGDEVEKIDLAHMATTIRAIRAAVEHLAGGEVELSYNAAGRKVLRLGR